MPFFARSRQAGVTLIEAMVTVAILAIVASIAVPSFQGLHERQRLVRVAETVLADVRWARSEAVKRNQSIQVIFTTVATGTNWQYEIKAGSSTLKTVTGGNFSAVTLSNTNFTSHTVTFNPARGTAKNGGTIDIKTSHYTAKVIVSSLGRVRVCGTVGGYNACP